MFMFLSSQKVLLIPTLGALQELSVLGRQLTFVCCHENFEYCLFATWSSAFLGNIIYDEWFVIQSVLKSKVSS